VFNRRSGSDDGKLFVDPVNLSVARTESADDRCWPLRTERNWTGEWRASSKAGRAPGSRAGGDVTIVIAGPVQFEAEDTMNLVACLQFDADERTLALRLRHVPVPGARPPGT
jgi:hypothetical protein